MANEFYDPGAARAEKVGALFARIARRYDLINDLQSFGLHRRWKRRLAEEAEVQPGQTSLDVCCGTGDIAFALARRGARVTGLDFSPEMLAVATRRLERAADNPRFLRGDALRLPFPDESFDIATVGYGLRNLSDWEAGLREMKRVVRPGGRLLVLDFGKPRNPVWRELYFLYLRCFVPLLGLAVCGQASAYAYILESLRHFPAQDGIADAMRRLGLTEVRIVNFLNGVMGLNLGRRPAGNGVANPAAGPPTC